MDYPFSNSKNNYDNGVNVERCPKEQLVQKRNLVLVKQEKYWKGWRCLVEYLEYIEFDDYK